MEGNDGKLYMIEGKCFVYVTGDFTVLLLSDIVYVIRGFTVVVLQRMILCMVRGFTALCLVECTIVVHLAMLTVKRPSRYAYTHVYAAKKLQTIYTFMPLVMHTFFFLMMLSVHTSVERTLINVIEWHFLRGASARTALNVRKYISCTS